jgi:tetratricopeptide (TPR) repeat protein
MKDFSQKYGDKGFKVIAVNVDGQNPSPVMLREITEKTVELDLPFPVVVDEGLKIFYAYGVIAVPSLALVDGEGHLRYGPSGYSFTIRDRIVDSTEVLLGLREVGDLAILAKGYTPKPKASRYYHLGRRLASQSLYERALGNLDQAVEEDSGFSSPHNLKGQIYLAVGKWGDAEGEFAKAIELSPDLTAAWAGWGRALLHQDNLTEAAVKLTSALELDETYTPALVDLAECRAREGDLDRAAELYDAALELNPRDPELLYSLGRFHRDNGNIPVAVAAYRAAVEQLVTLPILNEAVEH